MLMEGGVKSVCRCRLSLCTLVFNVRGRIVSSAGSVHQILKVTHICTARRLLEALGDAMTLGALSTVGSMSQRWFRVHPYIALLIERSKTLEGVASVIEVA